MSIVATRSSRKATGGQWRNRPGVRRWGTARRLALLLPLLVLALSPALAAADELTPLQRALAYLNSTQLRQPLDIPIGDFRLRDEPGDWPQYFHLQGGGTFRVRDVSPFMVAFIHHALTTITEDDRTGLELRWLDVARARAMRRRAVDFLALFESPPDKPDAGTFGFWPYDQYPGLPRPEVEEALMALFVGPILGGERVPLNLPVYPDPLAIPSDADVTAATWVALLDDALLDGGAGSAGGLESFFADWRDVGAVPRRLNPPWLPPASGTFLTWLAYRDDGALFPNDVDLVVNANVLFALGRHDLLDLAGAAEAVALINDVVAAGVHRDHPDEITDYYPDNYAFHYAVTRAFGAGVAGLAPSAAILADEIRDAALWRADGTVYWDRGAPQLNTAFAVLALLYAGRDDGLVDPAVDYLEAQQGPFGGFAAAPFFIARTDGGQVFEFYSAAFTTAMALEAMARAALR
jgi:hypothetical protein